jgi:nicotinamidase-related amidase
MNLTKSNSTSPDPPGRSASDLDSYALVVVDVQAGFDDPWWGQRNNPDCDDNIARLVREWSRLRRPLVYVRHDSASMVSPLHPSSPGNQLKPYLNNEPDLLVTKHVNSAFHGTPDLHAWLQSRRFPGIVVCGITTNHCCETTARVGGNLGYKVLFAVDATHTFDRKGPDGNILSADLLTQATAANLHGEFATVVSASDLLRSAPHEQEHP